ncbi:hypothetical protein [Enterococcus faecalis]|jgi:putative ABC transport system permease protein|uniref:hypothetical protein n=1 Tax=Enterococcus faecalis TaxID=1351 RepID=UPI0019EAB4A7|nr:hypothetical protein [Enterococcus faecalis]HAP3931886.1 hypothetical protein [Enterococcus faecalis]HBI1827916.1 hypothetical protein [Enterococcus faecalis]
MKARGILLIFALSTFALIGLTQLKEIADDIKFPAKYLIQLSSDTEKISSHTIYQLLAENSQKNQQQLFRTYLNDQGNESYFAFLPTLENKQKFETNLKKLANVSFESSYYSDKAFTEETLQQLKNKGVQPQSMELQWYLAGPALWSDGIRAVGLWSLTLALFFAYFSILYLYRKKTYVARFMGKGAIFAWKSWLTDCLTIIVSSVSLFGVFLLITPNNWLSMSALSLLSILLTNAIFLLLLITLGSVLFYQLTKYGNILAILKGKNMPILVNIIWFFGIVVTLLVIPLILNKLTNEQAILTQHIQGLKPWQQLKDYRTLLVEFPSDQQQVKNGFIDVSADEDYGKKFMNYFSEKDYIFAQQSAIIIPEQLSSQQKQEILKNYAKDKVKPEVTKHITYMNNNAYQINRQLQNETTENRQSKVPATMYVPHKYKADIESVKNATYMEFFRDSDIKRSEFKIVFVPNGRKTFLFDYQGAELTRFDKSRTQYNLDEIIVVLNMETVLAIPSAVSTYNNITNGLFSANALARLTADTSLTKNIADVISPYKSIQLKMNRLVDRINSAKLAVGVLVMVQFMLLLQFFTGMLKQHLKEISIKRLLGINLNQVLLMTFSYYLVLLLLTFIVAFLITNQALIKYLLLLGSIVEIVLVFFILKRIISKRTSDFLKGDFEI